MTTPSWWVEEPMGSLTTPPWWVELMLYDYATVVS